MKVAYERGLHELGDGLFAYLQPDGDVGLEQRGAGHRATASRCSSTRCSTCA